MKRWLFYFLNKKAGINKKKTKKRLERCQPFFRRFGEVKTSYLPVSHPKIQSKGAKKRSSIITPPYAK
jgi:hypothetical protein